MGRGGSIFFAFLLFWVGCSPAEPPFRLLGFVQEDAHTVRLNENLVFRFSQEIDPSSMSKEAVAIVNSSNSLAHGAWRVQGKEVRFIPRLPKEPDCSDAGLAPGEVYTVSIAGSPSFLALRSTEGFHLEERHDFTFQTLSPKEDRLFLFVDPKPDSGAELLTICDVPIEEIRLSGMEIASGSNLMMRFSEPIFPESVAKSDIQLNIINNDGVVDPQLDTLKLNCRVIEIDPEGALIAVEPQGGFRLGRHYKLWHASLDFVDFGGNRIKNTFNYISIKCTRDAQQ